MSSLARKPARGNWIWLAGALCAVAVLAGAAVVATTREPAGQEAAQAPGGSGVAAVPGGGAGQAGPRPRPGPGGPGGGSYLAGTPAVAVFYDPGDAVGSCSLGPFPRGGRYVSLPPERFGHSAACGSYVTVQGPRGLVRAEVVDLCPGCAANMIDLSRAAFTAIANPAPGFARVRYWPLDNPPLPGPLILRLSRTRTGRRAIQVRRHGNALAAVAVAAADAPVAAWRTFILDANGIWVAAGHLAPGPVDIRITDIRGHQVVIRRVRLGPARVIRTRVWMYPGRPG